ALVPLHLGRNPRGDLLLQRDAELVVPRPQTVEDLRAVGEALGQRAEVVVRQRAATVAARGGLIRGGWGVEVAVHDVVAVQVAPASRGGGDDAGGRRGAGVNARVLGRLDVLAEVRLQRRSAVAEQVVGQTDARHDVVEVRAVRVRDRREGDETG